MGKHRPRLKGKGLRWAKGQSSSSNPQTKKFRDAAKSNFFQENLGQSGLTVSAVKQHNVFQGTKENEAEPMADDEETLGGTYKTFQTFATDWSACTNLSFSRLLKGFRSDSALHKEMLAVLAAVTEVIKENKGKETTTEYFAALMTTLDVTQSEDSVAAILSLLGMGIKKVPESVLRLKFPETSRTFLDLLGRYAESDNGVVLRSLLGCLSVLLRAQEPAAWSSSSTFQAFDSVLAFTTHAKPKVRKAAQHAVCAVLKGSAMSPHPAAGRTAQFCTRQLETAGHTSTLHVLALLKETLCTFPRSHLKTSCETILRLLTLGDALVVSCGMQALHSLLLGRPPPGALPPALNAQLVSALYDYQPAPGDPQPVLAWLAVVQEAHANLARNDVSLCAAGLPRLFSTLAQLWLSGRAEVVAGATAAMRAAARDCVGPACTPELAPRHAAHLARALAAVEAGLKYQYHAAWGHVLQVLAELFQVMGGTCQQLLLPCLRALAELRDSYKFSHASDVELAVGRAVRSMGPEAVLQAIPLEITGRETSYEFRRSWLLPVLRENVLGSSLQFYTQYFLPLAVTCRKRSAALAAQGDSVGAHSYDLLQAQLWALLPRFCDGARDVPQSFKGIAKVLGTAIAEHKDLRISVMSALRKLVTGGQEAGDEEAVKEVARFAKNFLPILFNVYTAKPVGSDEEGQRLAAFETVKVYLGVADAGLCAELFDRAAGKLDDAGTDGFVRESVLDLLRALLPRQDTARVALLYARCREGLADASDHRQQKKAYRLLEELCGSETETCRAFVDQNLPGLLEVLLQALSSSAVPSKGARLRCLAHIVRRLEARHLDVLAHVVPEAVLCCKDLNERCRTAAYNLLVEIGHAMQRLSGKAVDDVMRDFVGLMLAGLAGSPAIASATILALARVTHEFKDLLPEDLRLLLLDNVTLLALSKAREIVAAALSYVKLYITSFPPAVVGPSLPTIVKSLAGMTEDCKRHLRVKTRNILDRLVRKFGAESVGAHVPPSDAVMLKRLRNLRKASARKRRERDQRRQTDSGDEDDGRSFAVKARAKTIDEILADSEDSAPEEEAAPSAAGRPRKRARQSSAWIQEDEDNFMDFTDAAAARRITATDPAQRQAQEQRKQKSAPFKTAPDGRLIIADDSDEDQRKIPRRAPHVPPLDSDDAEDRTSTVDTATLPRAGRKRRLSASTDGLREPAMKYQAGGSGIHRPMKRATRGGKPASAAATGAAYRSKKARGDMKRKGLPDPYAYVPLSRKMLNKRQRAKHTGQFTNLVRAARKGAQKGARQRARSGKKK
ncbi:LOW QUALITY PROTEIN: RRP12-like protein [Bacillus rossius redtenbacheri]|uniref:LOW QUALITY PROTEIN: RRP12-like protein n=1 Tax=Bacillus rossius redtenbacheri TaxID=93214 RepID=UPI002FDE9B97